MVSWTVLQTQLYRKSPVGSLSKPSRFGRFLSLALSCLCHHADTSLARLGYHLQVHPLRTAASGPCSGPALQARDRASLAALSFRADERRKPRRASSSPPPPPPRPSPKRRSLPSARAHPTRREPSRRSRSSLGIGSCCLAGEGTRSRSERM